MPETLARTNRGVQGVLIVLLLAGCALFAWRGPWRAVVNHSARWDGGLVYSLSRAWLIGANPYEASGIGKAWLDGGGPAAASPEVRGSGVLLYPPTTLVALSPVAAMPWSVAEVLWTALNIGMYAAALCAVAWLGQLRGTWLLGFLVIGVWLAPATTNVGVGQTALVPLGCVALAAWLVNATRNREYGEWCAGILLGVATAIKPQLALPYVVYQGGRLRWRTAVGAVLLVVVLGGIGVWRLRTSTPAWYVSWQRNMENFQLREDGNPLRANGLYRHQMINLHFPLHSFTDDRRLVNGLVYGLVSLPCLVYLVVDLRDQKRRGRFLVPGSIEGDGELLSLSMASAAMLLVAYHRFYDAAALIFPVGLAAAGLMRGERRQWVTLALCAPFLAPGSIVLKQLSDAGRVPAGLDRGWLWQGFILPHETWAIFLMMWWLVWLRWKRAGGS